jgi:UPF0271 protein
MAIDLNCDLGEGEPSDLTRALMQWITSANIACGGHAGDENSMRHCVQLAEEHGVNIGAHPGPADRTGKGRAELSLNADDLDSLVRPQVEALDSAVKSHGGALHHIKLHGALYHATESDEQLAAAYVELVRTNWPGTRVIAFAGGLVTRAAKSADVPFWEEAFADRAYQLDRRLVPRTEMGAVLSNVEEIIERVSRLISHQELPTHCGSSVHVDCDTLCVHSDSPNSVEVATQLSLLLGHSRAPGAVS